MMTEEVRLFTKYAPEIRAAAERVSQDWPSVTDTEDLARDLALKLFDEDRFPVLDTMPGYRRKKYLVDEARALVAAEVAEFEYSTGNSLYSVGEVRYLLNSGALINSRIRITAQLPDLDEGCRYLARVLPVYSRLIYAAFVYGNTGPVDRDVTEAAVRALTDCMNNINQGRKVHV
jgi:hypothetical protein